MKTMPACLRLSFFGLLVVVCLNGVVYVLLSSFHVPLPNSHRLAEKRLSFDSGRQQGLQRRIRVGGSGGDSGASTEDEYEPYDDVEPEPPPEEEGDDETLGLWSDGVASPTDDGASGWESGNGTAWNESVAGDFNFTLLEELWEKQVVDWAANSSAAESGGSGAQDGSEAGGGKEGEEGNRDDTIFGGGEQVGASTPGSGQGSGGDAAAVAERPPWPPPPPALPERIRANQSSWPIWWFAPFFDHTSFGREAATLVLGVLRGGVLRPDELWTAPTQGSCNYTNDAFMPPEDFEVRAQWLHPDDTCFPSPPLSRCPLEPLQLQLLVQLFPLGCSLHSGCLALSLERRHAHVVAPLSPLALHMIALPR